MNRSESLRHLAAFLVVTGALLVAGRVSAEYRESNVTNGGTVTGRVHFESEIPEAETIRPDRDADACGIRLTSEQFVVDESSKGLAYAIVQVEGISTGKAFSAADEAKIEQIKCRYEPHVTVVRPGKQFNIVNQDPILHNVHAYRGDETVFNLAQPFQGQANPQTLDEEGLIHVQCDVHSWMEAWLLVLDSPYFAVTDREGNFSIPDVPPGSYTIKMWHEVLGEGTKEVTVTAGGSSEVDFSIGG
jgi:plastocyanin